MTAWVSSYAAVSNGGQQGTASPEPKAERRSSKRQSSDGSSCGNSVSPLTSRKHSSDSLFVDVTAAQGREDLCHSSSRFLNGLRRYEAQPLDTVDEVVGFAKSGIKTGSMVSGIFTLVASAMGAGCLSLPHMFRQSGIGLGLILLASGAVLAHIGLVVLMSCARYTDCRSFAELVSLSSDKGTGRSTFVDAVIALYGLAAVLIYMMLIGDFFEGIAHSSFVGRGDTSRQTLILISLLVVFPLSVPRSVTALRYISILSTASIAFMTVVVMLKAPSFLLDPGSGWEVRWFRGDACSTLQSFSIALFAFSAHTNAVPVATALDHPRASVIWQVSLVSVLIELAIYSLIAACGYLSFLDDTKQDFIRNYPDDDMMMFVVRCVYSVPVVLGVPINLSPAVGSMKALVKCGGGGGLVGVAQHVAIIVSVLGVCTAVAIWCEAIADVIGLFGSCFGTLICLVWPRRIYHCVLEKLHEKSIGVPVGIALLSATLIGVLAFALQASEFARGATLAG